MLKGNAIVGQSGGPTAAINATLSGVIRGAAECEYIEKIYGAYNGVDGMLADTICDLSAYFDSEEKYTLLEDTPAAALGSCRKKLPKYEDDPDIYGKLFDFFKKYGIRYFFYIGGNDSMDTVAKLNRYSGKFDWEMRVMGVPKTIDNDVPCTDHTPGYGSAAKYIAVSMQEILRDCAVYTVPAVTIVEIMGRDAGWLTAAAGLPGIISGVAPDLIYLPEKPFDMQKFFADVRAELAKKPNVVIAVSEGVRDEGGEYIGKSAQSGVKDAFGHAYLSGTGKALEMAVKSEIGCKTRSVELNILQRCASHISSATDIEESVRVGRAAVGAAAEGVTGKMMVFIRKEGAEYGVECGSDDIDKIANLIKKVPDEFIVPEGNNVTDECLRYILPLIQGERKNKYESGLPVHIDLKKI